MCLLGDQLTGVHDVACPVGPLGVGLDAAELLGDRVRRGRVTRVAATRVPLCNKPARPDALTGAAGHGEIGMRFPCGSETSCAGRHSSPGSAAMAVPVASNVVAAASAE